VIPDCQVRPDVDYSHLSWVGNYLAEKRPDVIVQIGDFADMPSLSSYEKKGSAYFEGKSWADLLKEWLKLVRLYAGLRVCRDPGGVTKLEVKPKHTPMRGMT
jgi:hypothetical protein